MEKLTYKQARDKIWNAYFADEIRPMDARFCFCGTLAGGENWLRHYFKAKEHSYSGREYGKMEAALLTPFKKIGVISDGKGRGDWWEESDPEDSDDYENILFNGMLAALEVLKSIHRERGEVIPEDEPILTKRLLPA